MKVLVLGAAVSGMAAARLAERRGEDVLIYDRRHIHSDEFTIRCGDWYTSLL
jgi:flavin-dependent dehydrogenase